MIEIINKLLPQLIASVIVVVLVPFSKYVFGRIVRKYGSITLKSELRTLQVVRVVNILLNFTAILIIAVVWGVDTQNILVVVSSIFAVIGVAFFAQWSILSNITAGIILFFSTPFQIGDEIHILDKDTPIDATIKDISTFHTYLITKNGESIVIPNTIFLQKIVLVGEQKQI